MSRLGCLSDLQVRILSVLVGLDHPFVLTGGSALAGFHLGHRTTNDLDLFFDEATTLLEPARAVHALLAAAGLEAHDVQHHPTFVRLQVVEAGESMLVDLVADATPRIETPDVVELDGRALRVDTRHEILVNKLTVLLSRSEIRDLVDVDALLVSGGSLDRALTDAPAKDAGFSALTLLWLLEEFPVGMLAGAAGLDDREAARLDRVRADLMEEVAARVSPGE